MKKTEIRWCIVEGNGHNGGIYACPSPTDLLEEAEKMLKDEEWFSCCENDFRLKRFKRVRKLLEEK